jgi:hypothetical protein
VSPLDFLYFLFVLLVLVYGSFQSALFSVALNVIKAKTFDDFINGVIDHVYTITLVVIALSLIYNQYAVFFAFLGIIHFTALIFVNYENTFDQRHSFLDDSE